jgi:hypothetical protein
MPIITRQNVSQLPSVVTANTLYLVKNSMQDAAFITDAAGVISAIGNGTTLKSIVDLFTVQGSTTIDAYVEPSPARFYAFNDCMAPVNTAEWTFTTAGSSVVAQDYPVANSIGAVLDITQLVGNRYSIASPSLGSFQLGQGMAKFAARIWINTPSNATDSYVARVGFIDNITGESTDGVFFRFTDSVNGGKFEAVARNNNVETVFDTGVPAGGLGNYKLEIEVNANGTSAVFKINSAVVATITTNIPTVNGRETGYGLMLVKTVGINTLNHLFVDYLMVDAQFTNPR